MNKGRSLKLQRFFSCLLLLVALAPALAAQDGGFSLNESPLPAPTGFVNDYAGVIDAGTKARIESRLREFQQKTGVEIAVAVVRTTGDRPIFDYSLAVARGWKIGSKADDNPGALLFVAIDDRKYFTQISRDLEDELPDGVAGSLQRQYLVPEFKKGNYSKGISDTVDAYIAAIEYKLDPANAPPATGTTDEEYKTPLGDTLIRVVCCLAILIVIFSMIASRRGGKKTKRDSDRWGGGGFGGGGSALPWIIWGSSGGSSGSSSSSWDWGSSSGGSDWGGFSGGGDFGGGGAGGDW
ncbi:MAG: TPM domain-containing protein [Pyrinomonadaceae bacterium]|nr:TPM domain-containing protein [Pyrinomonadaceae bacterium]